MFFVRITKELSNFMRFAISEQRPIIKSFKYYVNKNIIDKVIFAQQRTSQLSLSWQVQQVTSSCRPWPTQNPWPNGFFAFSPLWLSRPRHQLWRWSRLRLDNSTHQRVRSTLFFYIRNRFIRNRGSNSQIFKKLLRNRWGSNSFSY